ncbi:unnamed protein product [Euphydryas editha]|uniref:Uncharacterized protein n=1 Tax=Euphydryas editha TaxID=104508 RepID=A0AAU9TH57_EUPED|nr:unnamed protein product [Euphydryas editha]
MSLCNTFRLFVSLIIVLSIIDTPAAFTLRRIARGEPSRHIAQESVSVEVKKVIKRSINSQTELIDHLITNDSLIIDTPKTTSGPNNENQDHSKNETERNDYSDETENPAIENQVLSSNSNYVAQTNHSETTTELIATTDVQNETTDKNKETLDTFDKYDSTITTNSRKVEFNEHETITMNDEPEKTTVYETTIYESTTLPTWKKYTTIDRKRQSTTMTDDDVATHKSEEMVKAETKQLRSSLMDTVTSDIPSLEQLKNDLLHSTLKDRVLGTEDETTSTAVTESISTTEIIPTSTKLDTFVSKRAGFLDLSEKVTNGQTLSAVQTPDFNINSKENMRSMFEIDHSETYFPEEKINNKAESQSQLNEDSINEELLKEKLIKENEDITQRFDSKIKPLPETQISNSSVINSSQELSVKPLSSDKIKNSSLYTVNPNYKPLKKIEVQAPKQFVRDPDDNSWRNESLSSLGIVFKPKNSSKPFTQVLKNKTETEWNSLSEKDSKNDIPDLKERLQKMAEKRKSKRKKTDSFGNIVYFDYEENSSSGEHVSTDQPPSTVTSSAEYPTTTEILNSTSTEGTSNLTTDDISSTTSTPEKIRGKGRNPYSTNKFKNFFKIPEYYDTTDEDDTDYLNMAKIDIKKFSTSTKTVPNTTITTPLATQRPWPFNKSSFTISPERKATIQYFPPLTTQKVNINDYDNDFKAKVNSFTTNIEPPKNDLGVSLDIPTTPVNSIQYTPQNNERLAPFVITSKPEYGKTFYPTQPPQTTRTEYTLLNEDVTFDRDSYVIRQYKDFINEAAKDNEFDKNVDYVPYTEAPNRDVTKTDLITYVTDKPKLNMDNEYDYETQFRKDVLQRFVDNFNQNSERFKSEFPILFNNSVIHRDMESGREIASSRAFMRGLYNTDLKTKNPQREAYDPNNDNMTVELSPSYELHYYMPEQEEKEQAVPQPVTPTYTYRL